MMSKLRKAIVAVAMACALLLPASAFAATSTSRDLYVGSPSLTISLASTFVSNQSGEDMVRVTTSGTSITVTGHSTIVPGTGDKEYYRIKINPLDKNTTVLIDKKITTTVCNGGSCVVGTGSGVGTGGWDFEIRGLDMSVLDEGLYQIRIARAGCLGSTPQYVDVFSQIFRNCIVKVTSTSVKVVKYTAIMAANQQARDAMDQWTGCTCWSDPLMSDMKDLMRTSAGGTASALTSAQANAVKSLADQIVSQAESAAGKAAGTSTDYEKARALYDYVSAHFFWDEGNPEGDNVVTSAYTLLMEAESGANAVSNCGGFSVSLAAMGRAEGIATRVVYGRHIDDKNWTNAANLESTNHHWVQMYIDGRWIDVDPFEGSSKVKKASTGIITYPNTTVSSYTFFDPDPVTFATGYITHGVYYEPEPLPTPSITLKGGASSVTVSWKAISGATEYKVFRSSTLTGTFGPVGTSTTTSFKDTGLVPGRKYYYKVRAYDSTGEASPSAASAAASASADLSAPKLTVAAGGCSVKISWPAVANATSYKIYMATSSTGTYSLVKTLSGYNLEVTGLTGGKTYYFKAKAVTSANSAADSAYSTVKSATAKKILATPTITLKGGAGSVTVSWKAVPGATGYKVYRSSSATGTYGPAGTVTTTSFKSTGLVPGRKYYFKVKAIDSTGAAVDSAWSEAKSATADLAAPSISVVATVGGAVVAWSSVANATSYKVYYATSKAGTYSLVKTTSSCKAEFTGLAGGTAYYFKVKAVTSANSAADSAYSAVKSVVVKCAQPTATLSCSLGVVTVKWNAVEGAASYKVLRSTSMSGTYTLVKTTTLTSWKDTTGLTKGKTYYYKVVAVAKDGESGNSASGKVKSIIIV